MSATEQPMTTAHPPADPPDRSLPISSSSAAPLPAVSASAPHTAPLTSQPKWMQGDQKRTIVQKNGVRRRPRKPKPPKDSRVYKSVLAAVALRAQGIHWKDIAEQIGISENTIKTYVQRAHQRGWININSFDDPADQLNVALKSATVQNIHSALNERTQDGGLTERAYEASIEVAKGTGLLKQHQVVKSDSGPATFVGLKVSVEMPQAAANQPALPSVRAGSLGGVPAIDAEVIERES